jgi:hypothetical protein
MTDIYESASYQANTPMLYIYEFAQAAARSFQDCWMQAQKVAVTYMLQAGFVLMCATGGTKGSKGRARVYNDQTRSPSQSTSCGAEKKTAVVCSGRFSTAGRNFPVH